MDKPNYFAIIPAPVLFDTKLSAVDKILFAHIITLTKKDGFCYASNKYFENVMDCSASTIKRALLSLESNGFITRELHYREGTKEVENRYIYVNLGIVKNEPTGMVENEPTPMFTDELDNSIKNNSIKDNNISLVVSPGAWKEFDKWVDNNMIEKWPFRTPKNKIWLAIDEFKKDKKKWSIEEIKTLVISIRDHLQWYLPQQGKDVLSIPNYFNAEKWLEQKYVKSTKGQPVADNTGFKSSGNKKLEEYKNKGF